MNFDFTDEQRMWREAVHDFVLNEVKPHARQVDEQEQLNWQDVHKMGPLGLLGLNVPEDYNGAGVDPVSAAIAIEELGWGCGSTALAIAAHNGLGCASVAEFGSEEVKRKFLPSVSSGRSPDGSYSQLAALALTEPGAGSDLKGGVTTRAYLNGDEWVIQGAKAWCTNAGVADFIVTLARTASDSGSHSLSLIVVPGHSPGLEVAPPEKKMGVRGSPTYAISYDQVHVPKDYLLGKTGDGLGQTLHILDGGRISIGALAVGLAQSAFDEALRYSRERHTFGRPLSSHQAIQWMLADSVTEIETARLMVYHAAWLKGEGRSYTQEAAMAKLFATEMSERVCRNAIQILGSYGYSREYPVERIYRDARLMTIGEGTSEVQRMVIAKHLLAD
jgi:alkylation response protein AidB-like acyl-CoA dehydrogenase